MAKTIYAENVLMPLLRQRQDAVNLQLLSQFGDDSLVWEYDDIIPKDEEYTLQVANEGLSRSALLINEWREQMGFDPLPNGDVLLVGGMLVAYGRDEPWPWRSLLHCSRRLPNRLRPRPTRRLWPAMFSRCRRPRTCPSTGRRSPAWCRWCRPSTPGSWPRERH